MKLPATDRAMTPAFPTELNTQPGFYAHHGLSKREYMATAILPAVIAATSAGQHHPSLDGVNLVQAMARDAVAMADELIAALSLAGDKP